MHNVNLQKREIQIGSRRHLHRNRQARQAGRRLRRRPIGRHRGPRHRLPRGQPARRNRLPSADRRLPRIHLRVGTHSRRILQARRQAAREGSADQPPDRSAIRPLFAAGWRYETQIIALLLSADQENDSDVLAITGASAALALSEIPFEKTIAGVRVGIVDGNIRHQPDLRRAEAEHARPHRRRQQRRHRDGRGRRQGSHRGAGGRRARSGARGDQADRRRDRRAEGRGRQEEAGRRGQGGRPRVPQERRRQDVRAARRRDADSQQARKLQPGRQRARRSARGARRRAARRGEAHLPRAAGEGAARRGPQQGPSPRRPQVRRDPSDLDRGQRAAAYARLGRLHARRDAGARHLHARHRGRRAEGRARERRVLQALHAALQLPAVLGRRDRAVSRAPAAARSATARWRSARSRRSFLATTSSPTPSASSPTSSSRTARRRWRRSAAARWR